VKEGKEGKENKRDLEQVEEVKKEKNKTQGKEVRQRRSLIKKNIIPPRMKRRKNKNIDPQQKPTGLS